MVKTGSHAKRALAIFFATSLALPLPVNAASCSRKRLKPTIAISS